MIVAFKNSGFDKITEEISDGNAKYEGESVEISPFAIDDLLQYTFLKSYYRYL